jgi:hypothetical protein
MNINEIRVPIRYEPFMQVKMVLDRKTMEKYAEVSGGKLMKIPKHFAPVAVHAIYFHDGRRWDVLNGMNTAEKDTTNER